MRDMESGLWIRVGTENCGSGEGAFRIIRWNTYEQTACR